MDDDAECSVELSFSAGDSSDVIADADVVLVAHAKDHHQQQQQHQLASLLSAKHQELLQLQRTHDEFVRSSSEYEKELEAEVERLERRAQQLQSQLHAQDDAHARLEATLRTTQRELEASQASETELRTQLQQLKRTIQRLEQTNDELETAQRVAQASLEELQHRLDVVTEENVFLQQERDASSGRSSRSHSGEDPTVAPLPPSTAAPPSVSVSALHKILQTKTTGGDAEDALRRERRVSDATGPEPANHQQRKRKSGRYPEVVEACLHMTCTHSQCRRVSLQRLQQQQQQQQQQQVPPAKAALQKAASDKKSTKRGFLERLRHRLFSV